MMRLISSPPLRFFRDLIHRHTVTLLIIREAYLRILISRPAHLFLAFGFCPLELFPRLFLNSLTRLVYHTHTHLTHLTPNPLGIPSSTLPTHTHTPSTCLPSLAATPVTLPPAPQALVTTGASASPSRLAASLGTAPCRTAPPSTSLKKTP